MTDNSRADISSLRIDRSKKNSDRPRSRKWLWLVWIVLLAAVVIGYLAFKENITPAIKVNVATAAILKGTDAQAALVATGYVVAQRKAEVASKGTGRLEYLGFEEGDTVATGEVIAELDNDDIKANLDVARAELMRAEADSFDAGRSFRRAEDLLESGSIPETEYEAAETAYKVAQANVAAAKAAARAAEVALENTYIRAPFDGTVLAKNADVGEIVAPFASSASSKGSVVTLADMNSLEVEADVSESNIHKVIVGQTCEIILDAYPGVRFPGYVKKIVPTADRARATVLTKVAFDELDDRVLPEMSARVNFFVDESDVSAESANPVISVPKEAITTRNGRKTLFVVEGEYAYAKETTVGRELGPVTEIVSGVQQGDRVILSPPGRLESGQKVEITK